MKKLLFLVAIASFTFACNDSAKPSTTSTDTAAVATPPAAPDSSAAVLHIPPSTLILKPHPLSTPYTSFHRLRTDELTSR